MPAGLSDRGWAHHSARHPRQVARWRRGIVGRSRQDARRRAPPTSLAPRSRRRSLGIVELVGPPPPGRHEAERRGQIDLVPANPVSRFRREPAPPGLRRANSSFGCPSADRTSMTMGYPRLVMPADSSKVGPCFAFCIQFRIRPTLRQTPNSRSRHWEPADKIKQKQAFSRIIEEC